MSDTTDLLLTLAWSLLHFLWQGAVIAVLAAALMQVLRQPATRYLIGVGALVLMFASFGVTFSLLNEPVADAAHATITPAAVGSAPAATVMPPAVHSAHASVGSAPREFLWLAQGWIAGVGILALRLAFGLMIVEYLRRRNLVVLPEVLVQRFEALQQRLGLTRLIRYRECALVSAPAVVGFFRPIVLVPMRALTGLSPEQLEAVIAHELGHVKRYDVAVNFVQVIAETLFFFHPAVWWLNRRIRADREDCCDDIALELTRGMADGKLGYARALATMASWRDTPRFAMAATGGALSARVARLLGAHPAQGTHRMASVLTISVVLATATLAGMLAFGWVAPAVAQPALATADNPVAQVNPPSPEAAPSPVSPASAPAPRAAQQPRPARPPVPARPAAPAREAQSERAPDARSYLDAMSAAGVEFDVDQLIAMKVHDITPEYITSMRDAGLEIDADSLIALKVHEVTPDYIRAMRVEGFEPSADDLIAMKVHEVTPEYRKAWEANGFKPTLHDLIAAKVHGLTPEFLEKARAHGFDKLSFEQLIRLKHADVL